MTGFKVDARRRQITLCHAVVKYQYTAGHDFRGNLILVGEEGVFGNPVGNVRLGNDGEHAVLDDRIVARRGIGVVDGMDEGTEVVDEGVSASLFDDAVEQTVLDFRSRGDDGCEESERPDVARAGIDGVGLRAPY